MGFVKEEASEEDIKKFDLKLGYTTMWMDRERDACFIYRGGGMEIREFELHYEGQTTKMQVCPLSTERESGYAKFDMTYEFVTISIPDGQVHEKENIYALITEAFKEYGFAGNKERAATVTVNIPQRPRQIPGLKPNLVKSS